MIDLIEVFDRAETGPLTSETDYYMKRYVPKLAEVIARHKVKWDKETIINADDTLTDAVFEAAEALAARIGRERGFAVSVPAHGESFDLAPGVAGGPGPEVL